MSLRWAEPRMPGMVWYCARTQPKHEHIAAANLRRTLGLEVFHPRVRLRRLTRRGLVRVVEPLFPCYLFVRGGPTNHLDDVRYAIGISSLVHFGPRIPTVPDDVIDELRVRFGEEEPMVLEGQLQAGVDVALAEGVFLGSRGIVVRALPARQRVQILLDFLGRTTVAEVDRASLVVENRWRTAWIPRSASDCAASAALA